MAFDVRLWGDETGEKRAPDAWPSRLQPVADDAPPPAAPWQRMTEAEYAAYLDAHRAEYEGFVSFRDNQRAMIAAAASAYAERIAAGYAHDDGHLYQLGPTKAGSTGILDLQSVNAMVDAGVWPADGFIRDAENLNVPKDGPAAAAVAKGAAGYVFGLRRRLWEITDSARAAAAQADLDAIDLSTGWP